MAKQRKNSNYVTEKTVAAKEEKALAEKKKEQIKQLKVIGLWSAVALLCVSIVVFVLLATGLFEYKPEVTYHATISFTDGTSLHVELYGNDAPYTVEHFVNLCRLGYFDGKDITALTGGQLFIGDEHGEGEDGVLGEFSANGIKNNVPMNKGTLCMGRAEGYDSGYGQIFFLTQSKGSLKGDYAAFGCITDTTALTELLSSCEFDVFGSVVNAPTIKSISLHEAH